MDAYHYADLFAVETRSSREGNVQLLIDDPVIKRRAMWWLLGLLVFLLLGYVLLGPVAKWMAEDEAGRDSVRDALVQFLSLGAVLAALLNWNLATRQRTTDSYIAALDLLGAETATRRVAGIYALERIMRNQPQYHAEIVEILESLVQEVTRDFDYEKQLKARLGSGKLRPRQDVQKALAVLGRRPRGRREQDRLRLADTYLEGVNLRGARLENAVLRRANLANARLEDAGLARAELRDANLRAAHLQKADLRGANLTGAHLAGAKGVSADDAQLAAAHCSPTERCSKTR